MKAIIVEDEQHNSRLLLGLIQNIRPDWEISGIFESIKASVQWLHTNPAPDLIFMDIQLTDGICFSIFKQVEVQSLVIFTTAYDEYAVQAFEVNSIDYLLKPIKEERLLHALLKFEKLYHQPNFKNETPVYQELLEAIQTGGKKYRKRFLVAGPTAYFKIDTNDIAYFYTENRVTFAVSFAAKRHVLDLTIEKIESQLDTETFFRANRSYILHIDSIQKIENYFGGKLIVKLIPPFKETISISRLKATEFKQWLDG